MKNLIFLSDPIVWLTIILCFSFFSEKKKWKILGIILFAILTNNWLGYFALHLWEVQTIQINDIQEPYEIAIVLGSFIKKNKTVDNLNTYVANDRFRHSIELYEKGKFKKFLLSGNDKMDSTITFLLNNGIPSEDIMFEDQSLNTYENALFSKQLLNKKKYNSRRILLITSASHMRRAKKCFDAVKLPVTPFSVNYKTSCSKLWKISIGGIIPSSSALFKWQELIREWMSMFLFLLKGYIII